jgi:WD repeat-containing protein 61
MVKLSPLCYRERAHDAEAWCVAFTPDSATLVTGSLDETVKTWNVSSSASSDAPPSSSSSSSLLASSEHTYTGHTLGVIDVDVVERSSGETLIAAAALDGVTRVWDATTGETRLVLESAPGESWGVKFDPSGATTATSSVLIAVGGGVSSSVRLYDAMDGTKKQTLEVPGTTADKPKNGRFAQSVAYSADGKRIACGVMDGTVAVFDVKSGTCVHTLDGHGGPVRDVTFSPDGKTLYSASDDGYVHVWDAHNKSLIDSLAGHKSWVLTVAASPCGSAVVTGSSDATLKLWDLSTRACVHTVTEHTDAVWRARFAPDGSKVAAVSSDAAISLFNVV